MASAAAWLETETGRDFRADLGYAHAPVFRGPIAPDLKEPADV